MSQRCDVSKIHKRRQSSATKPAEKLKCCYTIQILSFRAPTSTTPFTDQREIWHRRLNLTVVCPSTSNFTWISAPCTSRLPGQKPRI